MAAIPYNPYIVGNPIKTREMFFGREDDFQYVERKIGAARTNQVLVFCGERRSGKTSILFQILNGRLGERFLPVLVDMQILAGIRSDDQFWRSILRVACESLAIPGLSVESLETRSDEAAGAPGVGQLLDSFLRAVERVHPERIVLFLIDEYELIEEKIQDGSLSEATIHLLSGALESPHHISFVFTGSTNLENRKVSFWKALLAKSIYRKISYLSANDTARLITEPLEDHVRYPAELVQAIYRLTGGHPFYTQVICQNLVDQLMEESRGDPQAADLERIVKGIVDNPLPQMIYSWASLANPTRVLLAALGGVLKNAEDRADVMQILQFLRRSRLRLPFSREQLLIHLEEAYHEELLEKDQERYRFRMDLLRRWVRQEHSIWKVAKETGAQLKSRRRIGGLIAAAAALGVLAAGYFLVAPRMGLNLPLAPSAAGSGTGPEAAAGEKSVRILTPDEPFYGTWINEDYAGTSAKTAQKFVYYKSGKAEGYKSIGDETPFSTFTFTLVEKWKDVKGNLWYKELEHTSFGNQYMLCRISKKGDTLEQIYRSSGFPEESDMSPSYPNYWIFHRQ